MGGLIRNMDYWWKYFKDLFKLKTFYVVGSITLGPGEQELSISTDIPNPVRVYLSMEEPDDGITTCIGDLNWVAAKIRPYGFMLYADIKSNSCEIKYVVEYQNDDNHRPDQNGQ